MTIEHISLDEWNATIEQVDARSSLVITGSNEQIQAFARMIADGYREKGPAPWFLHAVMIGMDIQKRRAQIASLEKSNV